MTIKKFQHIIWQHYEQFGRDLPWRRTHDPYRILVSEIMLQQTQVSRVLKKYPEFLRAFPNFSVLSRAPLLRVLKVWQGMGYNRRAIALKKIAQIVMHKYRGRLPRDPEALARMPGIGRHTAGSIAAFAFNVPAIFIETNIRRTFIHHFFPRGKSVADAEIETLAVKTLDLTRPREWYFALMDYGAHLAHTVPNANRKSAHYKTQSKFEGSNRQMRGVIIKMLITHGTMNAHQIMESMRKHGNWPTFRLDSNARVIQILTALIKEGFIKKHGSLYRLR